MTWQTGTATDYKDLLTKLVQVATGKNVSAAALNAAGTGYTANDLVTVAGGTSSFAATIRVLTIGGGGSIATFRIETGGAYTVDPSTTGNAVTGGTGSGATFNLTMTATGWTAVRNTTPGGEKEVILQGVGSGSDTIFVGIKTYQVLSQNAIDTAFNWTLIGMTGFNSGLAFESQPGVSPGGVPVSTGGAYVPLKTSDAFDILFWFSITGRRIMMFAQVRTAVITHYMSCYLGWLNPYGTSSEYPYPIYIAGSAARHDALYKITSQSFTGLTECMGLSGKTGPAYFRKTDSTWQEVKNCIASDGGSPTRVVDKNYTVYPCGQTSLTPVASDDLITSDVNFDWDNICPAAGVPGVAGTRLQRTPMTGGALHLLVPATIVMTSGSDLDVLGELDDVFWFSAASGAASLDTLSQSGNIYRVFQNGNRTETYSFMAIREG